jgi:peptide/nickel transport system ATP-binding protein
VQAQILDLLAQQRESGMAMILVTHDLGVVAGRADEIAVMYAGKLDEPSHTRLEAIPGRPPDLVNPPPGCRFAPRCPYAQDKCRAEEPPLIDRDDPGTRVPCWYPVGTPAGETSRSRRTGRQAGRADRGEVRRPDGRHRHRAPARPGRDVLLRVETSSSSSPSAAPG